MSAKIEQLAADATLDAIDTIGIIGVLCVVEKWCDDRAEVAECSETVKLILAANAIRVALGSVHKLGL